MPGASGQYQFFAHEYKTANGIGLRADTPFTSPPLDDDFDAITQRWSRTTRQTTVEPTASGLYDRLEAVTRTATPAVAAFANHRGRKKMGTHGDANGWTFKAEDVTPGRSLRRVRGKDRIKTGGMNGRSGLGPIAGQDYEIVEYEIVEEGPERTVSISTWREQAIQEADSDDAMSVYYVTADDCIHADATEIDVATEFVPPPRKAAETANVASGSGSNNSGDKSKSSGKSRSSRRRENQPGRRSSGAADTSPSKTYQVAPGSGPRTSTPRGSGTLIQPLDEPANVIARTPPFHATNLKSGSTISSIDLTPATPTLENVLVSCEPSLIHIFPILQRVGIMRVEHLRAVGKLSEETRNKEVKEEVLKLGVTVMEWAILLDKLQAL